MEHLWLFERVFGWFMGSWSIWGQTLLYGAINTVKQGVFGWGELCGNEMGKAVGKVKWAVWILWGLWRMGVDFVGIDGWAGWWVSEWGSGLKWDEMVGK